MGKLSLQNPARKEENKEVTAKTESKIPICNPEKPMLEK